MTRINVVPVQELTDNFILAEFFELPRLYPLILKAANRDDRELPLTYRLGEGHMRFFYNKLDYLSRRHEELWLIGRQREIPLVMDPSVMPIPSFELHQLTAWWWQDYQPTESAIQINRSRLAIRERFIGGIYGDSHHSQSSSKDI